MAQKIEIVLIDDLDGTPADETLQFGVDGRHYEIDLSAGNARELREHLQEYVRRARTEARPPRPRQDAARIRAWALHNGFAVAPRGRLHRDVLEAYSRAHP
ncbi:MULTISPECIES: histone-like nucleoid-structuring protein Lsr2 [Citricoccus]|uniref:histone-like nucleoid-structuring protein Lsr2 n=1 Tax=Citricoccus TaxID=169133 RepID=UPI00048A961F|nr:Lsr2 family protein [Citricoccus sp. CH26A]